MKYQEALEKVEAWLVDNGIRDICHQCKGQCCIGPCEDERCSRPPLPCATYLCNELRDKMFGFHNGEKYHARHLLIASIIFGNEEWGPMDLGPLSRKKDVDIDIPDNLIEGLVNMGYEPDDHGYSLFETKTDAVRTELLSYLFTKAEECSEDFCFKTSAYSLGFMERSSRSLGKVCGQLRRDGLIEKVNANPKSSVWRTKFMGENET